LCAFSCTKQNIFDNHRTGIGIDPDLHVRRRQ
jgi:hypothetical protein